jgi:hypothetical protein
MTADEVTDAILQQMRNSAQTVKEVALAWREAHGRARLAYEQWCMSPGEATYAQYRAAQDQADSAQDELHARHMYAGAAGRRKP